MTFGGSGCLYVRGCNLSNETRRIRVPGTHVLAAPVREMLKNLTNVELVHYME